MQAQSRQPTSNQHHLHPKLAATVRRHLDTRPRKPVAPHNIAAFKLLLGALADRPRPLILDSFCGTGHSTATLAQQHPQHLVVGIDKSSSRLNRHPDNPADNYLLLQAECEDLWQLLVEEGIGVDRHYLLYPNPWPKAKHLQRRVHGGASLYWLLQLAAGISSGGASSGQASPCRIELRSNWQIYVEEFGAAMQLAACPGTVARIFPEPALSLFECKYRDSGHDLWAFTGTINPPSSSMSPRIAGHTVTNQPI